LTKVVFASMVVFDLTKNCSFSTKRNVHELSVARGLQPPPPHWPEGKNALSAHLRGVFSAIGVSNVF